MWIGRLGKVKATCWLIEVSFLMSNDWLTKIMNTVRSRRRTRRERRGRCGMNEYLIMLGLCCVSDSWWQVRWECGTHK